MPNEVKLLPCEPTPEMASAGMHIIAALPADSGWIGLTRAACDVYRAMAKAAPTSTLVTDEVVERLRDALIELRAAVSHHFGAKHPNPAVIEEAMELARAAIASVEGNGNARSE